jgi:hypothetical protein
MLTRLAQLWRGEQPGSARSVGGHQDEEPEDELPEASRAGGSAHACCHAARLQPISSLTVLLRRQQAEACSCLPACLLLEPEHQPPPTHALTHPLITPPQDFCDPITLGCMQDPVLLCGTGQVYCSTSLRSWLATGSRTCPRTNLELRDVEVCWAERGRVG